MTARLSLLFSYDKDKQMFYYSLLCIYSICSTSVLSSKHGVLYISDAYRTCDGSPEFPYIYIYNIDTK